MWRVHLVYSNLSEGGALVHKHLNAAAAAAERGGGARALYCPYTYANKLLAQLRHSIPPPQIEPPPPPHGEYVYDWCYTFVSSSSVSGTGAARNGLSEPFPFPPFSYVLGEIEFERKSPHESECSSKRGKSVSLVAAALTPGVLKRGKEIYINHFHVSLNQAIHASVHRQKGIGHQHPTTRQGARRNRWSSSR